MIKSIHLLAYGKPVANGNQVTKNCNLAIKILPNKLLLIHSHYEQYPSPQVHILSMMHSKTNIGNY